MKQLTFRFEKCKLTLQWEYTDSCLEGYTDEEDTMLGWGNFTIPLQHREPLIEFYGEPYIKQMGIDFEYEFREGQDNEMNNSDMFILWMHWLINTEKSYVLKMKSEHIFWPIHDLFHAKHDVVSAYFYCSLDAEVIRFRQAYAFLKRRSVKVKNDYLERITDAFNERKYGCDYHRQRNRLRISHIKTFTHVRENVL